MLCSELIEKIKEAPDVKIIRSLREQAHEEFLRLFSAMEPIEWNSRVNQFHDSVIVRVLELAEQETCRERSEPVPLPYAFLLFGSGGRSEQTLWSDQDNGLIFADPADEEERVRAEAFFEALAIRISGDLEAAGYPPCSGGVLCTREKWRQPVSGYSSMINKWLTEPIWENVRYLLIAADLRTIYGDPSLAERLIDEFYSYYKANPVMYDHLLKNTLHHKVSIGVFGQLIRERYGEDAGGIDIKYGAYIPLVNSVRLLALEMGIRSTTTENRIRLLIHYGYVPEDIGSDWLDALAIVLKLRSLTPYQLENGHYQSRGVLTAEQLTKERISELKLCLRIGTELQKYVKKAVRSEMDDIKKSGEWE